jgi:hypothetical protein
MPLQVERFADAVIARPVERHAGGAHAEQRLAERRAIRISDGEVIEARRPFRRRIAALAFPGIQTDVMVIAAGAQECRGPAHALRDFKAKHARIERDGTLEICNFQVHVPDLGAGIDALRHAP